MHISLTCRRSDPSDGEDEWKDHQPQSHQPVAPTASYPDLAVENPVVGILIEALLWIHIDAVTFQVFLDLGPKHRRLQPGLPILPFGTQISALSWDNQITLLLKASRSSMVRLSARAITGTTFTVRHSRCRNSMSRGRRLPGQGRDSSGSAIKCMNDGKGMLEPNLRTLLFHLHPMWVALPGVLQQPHQCPVGGTKYTQQCTRVSGM